MGIHLATLPRGITFAFAFIRGGGGGGALLLTLPVRGVAAAGRRTTAFRGVLLRDGLRVRDFAAGEEVLGLGDPVLLAAAFAVGMLWWGAVAGTGSGLTSPLESESVNVMAAAGFRVIAPCALLAVGRWLGGVRSGDDDELRLTRCIILQGILAD